MGREVRKVPFDWQHPKDARGRFVPLHDTSFDDAVRQWEKDELPEWLEGAKLWATGFVKTYSDGLQPIASVVAKAKQDRPYASVPEPPTYEWWAGDVPRKPTAEEFMPDWPDDQRTHLMMYEDTSEGAPISPAFDTPEKLARWLADNEASAFASQTATYDQWLRMIHRGSAISAVFENGVMKSGVAAL